MNLNAVIARGLNGASHTSAGEAPRIAQAPPRVALVVDDDLLIGSLISQRLARSGWRTMVASNAGAALTLSDGLSVDLLVTDYQLPGLSGAALAVRLRERAPELPVIIVSGSPDAAPHAESLGFRFVRKPFDADALMAAVDAL